jgi:hypothetical protein
MADATMQKRIRILAYGVEKTGIQTPQQDIVSGKYTIEFADYSHADRFQHFDGSSYSKDFSNLLRMLATAIGTASGTIGIGMN